MLDLQHGTLKEEGKPNSPRSSRIVLLMDIFFLLFFRYWRSQSRSCFSFNGSLVSSQRVFVLLSDVNGRGTSLLLTSSFALLALDAGGTLVLLLDETILLVRLINSSISSFLGKLLQNPMWLTIFLPWKTNNSSWWRAAQCLSWWCRWCFVVGVIESTKSCSMFLRCCMLLMFSLSSVFLWLVAHVDVLLLNANSSSKNYRSSRTSVVTVTDNQDWK